MRIDSYAVDGIHGSGDHAMHPIAPRSTRHAALLLLVGKEPTASSRLAWHADHGTLGRIPLRNAARPANPRDPAAIIRRFGA